jgi:hypothetical protein
VYPLESIALPVTFGTEENFRTENVQFDVAEDNLPFNAIIGRPTLYRFIAIAHYGYLVLKMPSHAGVLTVWGDCPAALAAVEKLHAMAAEAARPDDVGRDPSTSCTKTPTKVPKVQPSRADSVPVKTIRVSADSRQTTRIVPKANGKLRMCIDYTSLNKACPKDSYPLPRIDQIVDSTSRCDLLSFLDAYSGFHQIQMSRQDRKHTAFVTVDGLYFYVVMPYGLKNALPTFVWAMSMTFGDLIRDRVEVYVDDIVVKTKRGSTLVEDITPVFDKLRATRTKLNPDKCVFGVSAGKLLGFLVSHRGIEANPEKIKAIETMRPPARIKDIQKLAGSLAALSRIISRLGERALPFFRLLRKSGPFSWTEEAERAFQELKQHLVSLPILVALEPGEPLNLYIAAASEAVSMVLVAERAAQQPQGSQKVPLGDGGGLTTTMLTKGQEFEDSRPTTGVRTIQKPVYYVSEVLHEAKARYLETHKPIYAILVASRKLCHYF